MKVLCLGIDQLTTAHLKENGINAIDTTEMPSPEYVKDNILIFSSEFIPPGDLRTVRNKYLEATLIYWYQPNGLRNNQVVFADCSSLNIHFLSSRATADSFLNKLQLILKQDNDRKPNLIGFFGTAPGVGCTTVASTVAWRLANQGVNVILLGLDLFDPGYNERPVTSLDQWRPKMTGKIISDKDFEQLPTRDGYPYLPGNLDYFAAEDFSETEIEYLLDQAQQYAEIVIADFGSIPHSAAWSVGIERSNFRYMVVHNNHLYRLQAQLELMKHLDVYNTDFYLIVNKSDQGEIMASDLSVKAAIPLHHEFTTYDRFSGSALPLGKKELTSVDEQLSHLLVGMGIREMPVKRRFL